MGFSLFGGGGGLGDLLFGGGDPGSSGSFPKNRELGTALQQLLMERLTTQPADTMSFKYGSGAIRDALSGQSGAARQRLGDSAVTGGYADSGVVQSGMIDIDRSEGVALTQGITQLLLGLEDRRMEGVLPFLQGASGEHLGRASLEQQQAQMMAQFVSEQTKQAADFFSSFSKNMMG